MKIKDGFMLREIVGTWVVVPIRQRVVEFNGLISLSESSALLWKKLESGANEEQLIKCILGEYDVDENTAMSDIKDFLLKINEKGFLQYE